MGLFTRRKSRSGADAIADFWAWWNAEGARLAAAAIESGGSQQMVEEISPRVHAINPDLGWELAKGSSSEHVLVVTAGGNPDIRSHARRWRMAAPPADATWEYSDTRLPVTDPSALTLEIAGHRIDGADMVVAAEAADAALHVQIHHPSFERMPSDARMEAAFLMLDATLGEADVETWIGEIDVAETAPAGAEPLADLPDKVQQLREEYTDEDGELVFALLQGEDRDGNLVVVTAQRPLRAATAPHLDTHVAIAVPFREPADNGMPGRESLRAVHDLESHLTERLGGSGRIVASKTRGGVRILHLYVDSMTPAIEQLRAAVGGWTEGRIKIEAQLDPAWEAVAHLR